MATAAASNEGKSYSDINMTPLIDVMLVLLIIFIITIPSQTNSIKIDNPIPQEPPPALVQVIDLSIDFDGSLAWNAMPMDRATMQDFISLVANKTPQPEVHIIANRFARYEVVAQTLADLQRRGLKKIGFLNNDSY
jgi:biopolymer transport protein ExbD